MNNTVTLYPLPGNEAIRAYAPGSAEKVRLKSRLGAMLAEPIEIPVLVGGREIFTGRTAQVVCPHHHSQVLAIYHQAGPTEVQQAQAAAREAWHSWSALDWHERARVFLKAAELLSGPWRETLNAATILNQSKTIFQAEIDAACELIDFWRFNAHFMGEIYAQQPQSSPGVVNCVDYRPLEGFVLAVSPFNFTSIAGNLPSAPAMMGNTVLWKPASTAVFSGYQLMQLWKAAGLPDGVINFLPGPAGGIGAAVLASAELAGLHFTGSTAAFQSLWRGIAQHIADYESYPRIVGETGGKNFVYAHPSADVPALVTALVRGAFEYQGQKCSAASRAYIPRSLWPRVKEALLETVARITVGDPADFRHFMAALINQNAFHKVMGYLDLAKVSGDVEILCGGGGDATLGYFVQPTVLLTSNPRHRLMQEEIFGPVLTIYVYEEGEADSALQLCANTSRYGLTGAIFAQERNAIAQLTARFRHSAGNFYVNDKPTGAVVGQQPFGGSRASGTNDKAGSALNLLRWTSPRAIKETFNPPGDFPYPHMGAP